jgi:hypothetical protein
MIHPWSDMKSCSREDCTKKSQSMKQLEEVIEEIRELMLRSAEEVISKEKLDRKGTCTSSNREDAATTTEQRSRKTTPGESLGSRRISTELGSS